MKTSTFTITADHLTLLSASEWQESNCEFGAPEMDPKRPYGNSSVEMDIAELLIPGFRDLSDAEQERVLDAEVDRLVAVHRELPAVLNVATSAMRLAPGTYTRVGRGPWSLVPADPEPEPDPSDPRQIAVNLMLDAARSPDRSKVWAAIDEARPGITAYARHAERDGLLRAVYELAETADITIGWSEAAEVTDA